MRWWSLQLYLSAYTHLKPCGDLFLICYVFTGTINWALVNRQQDYFESIGRPPLLQHTWSLAVEAQFYLIWPLVLLFVLKFLGKRNISFVALGIALASGAALFAYSIQIDIKESAVSHVYFGTDTHSIGLFLGSALAVSWKPQNLTRDITKRAQDFIDLIGVFGLLGLLSTFLFISRERSDFISNCLSLICNIRLCDTGISRSSCFSFCADS